MARQGSAAYQWCAANGYELDQDLDLADPGRSAFHGHHLTKGALGEFLALASSGSLGTAPVLLVEAIDRLSRQEPLDALETILQGLVGSGVRIITLEDGNEYSRGTLKSDPTKLIVLVVKVQAAHEYSARLSMRMRANWQQIRDKAAQGQHKSKARRPFWIDYNPNSDEFILNCQAKIIERIFDLVEEGNGLSVIARILNREGFTTPGGKPWDPGALQWLVKSPLVCGTATFLRRADEPVRIENYYPAVISQERLDSIIRLRRSRSGDKSLLGRVDQTHWIAQGITKCTCGAPAGAICTTKTTAKRGKVKTFYLMCKASKYKAQDGNTCRQVSMRLRPAMAHLLLRLSLDQVSVLFESSNQDKGQLAKELAAREELELKLSEAEAEAMQAASRVKEAAKAGAELSLLSLLNDATEEAKARCQEIQLALSNVLERVTQLQHRPSADSIANQFRPAVEQLLTTIAGEADTSEQRRALNLLLRKLQITIHLDGNQGLIGMQYRDSEIDWQPISASLSSYSLKAGAAALGGQFIEIDMPEDIAAVIGDNNTLSIQVDSERRLRPVVVGPDGEAVDPALIRERPARG
jgi:DNA invertase Pin-like site-specific DNA recombinase